MALRVKSTFAPSPPTARLRRRRVHGRSQRLCCGQLSRCRFHLLLVDARRAVTFVSPFWPFFDRNFASTRFELGLLADELLLCATPSLAGFDRSLRPGRRPLPPSSGFVLRSANPQSPPNVCVHPSNEQAFFSAWPQACLAFRSSASSRRCSAFVSPSKPTSSFVSAQLFQWFSLSTSYAPPSVNSPRMTGLFDAALGPLTPTPVL